MEGQKMIYVAAPFWHPDPKVRKDRRQKTILYSMRLTRQGLLNYSPLLYSERYEKTDVPERYWLEHGLRMVDACDTVRVLCLPGWDESGGIAGEVARAEEQGKTVEYVYQYKRLAFCGSRTLAGEGVRERIHQAITEHQPEMVVTHGEPGGVCTLAQEVSRELGVPLKTHFLRLERAAGKFHHRSRAVFEDCDYCVFYHDGVSTGTNNELQLARDMGILHEYHRLDPEQETEARGGADLLLDTSDLGRLEL